MEEIQVRLEGKFLPINLSYIRLGDGNITGGEVRARGIAINWQRGRIEDGLPNGALAEDIVDALINRFETFQQGPLSSDKTDAVVEHLRSARAVMQQREDDRRDRGVLNTYED